MQKSSFFNSVGGDRKYKAEEIAEYFSSFIGNGIFPNPATNLFIQAGGGMTVRARAGKAWINGYYYLNTSEYNLTLDTADGVQKRIDRLVVRLSFIDREIALAVKKGTNASTPAPPALQRDADMYELGLADILINNGATEITQGNITDLRYNPEHCGLVSQLVQSVDTSTLAAQLDAWFKEYQNKSHQEYLSLLGFFEMLTQQANGDLRTLQQWFLTYQAQATTEFLDWFNSLKDILDEEAETHILNLIFALTERVTMLEYVIFNDIKENPFLIIFDNLNGIKAGGVWNATLQRLEC